VLRAFAFSGLLTIGAVLWALTGGVSAALTVLVLIAIEIAFSFDNAIINAKVLERLSHFWQQLFLTVGVVIAVIGMRLLFPIVIVVLTAHVGWRAVIDEALHHPDVYARQLGGAHTAIAAFGGAFLLTLALYFLLDDSREVLWLERLERPLQRIGGAVWLPPLVVVIVMLVVSHFSSHTGILRAGLVGALGYAGLKLFIDGLGRLSPGEGHYTGWAAFLAFMYLQVLDASFSFDGVLGAFAITNKVLLIALGLGVGAFWVRSLTVVLVRRRTLGLYIYLEHGAHYAILVLAAALLASLFWNVPGAVTGITGLGVIAASFIESYQALHSRASG
jgi:uncharacterized protein